jgi:hypothetical protein
MPSVILIVSANILNSILKQHLKLHFKVCMGCERSLAHGSNMLARGQSKKWLSAICEGVCGPSESGAAVLTISKFRRELVRPL